MQRRSSSRRHQLLIRAAMVVLAAAATAAVINVGCADLMGMDPGSPMPDAGAGATGAGGSAGSGTAGSSAGGSAGSGGQPCEHASYPPPPTVTLGGGAIDFVVALRRLNVAETPDGGPVGLDLDRLCTCQGEGSSCLQPAGGADCDLPGGRDNAFAHVFGVFGAGLGHPDAGDQFFSDQAEVGAWTLLLRVRGYNGEPDDDQVEVAWYVSQGFEGSGDPAWNGSDSWSVVQKSVEHGPDGGYSWDYPKNVDGSGYVTDGVLVAGLPNAALELYGGQAQLFFEVTTASVMGRLEETPNGWALRDGLITGRVIESNVFRAIASLRNAQGDPMCRDHFAYADGKELVCEALDLHGPTGGTPTQPCEAVSVGIGFESDPAMLGNIAIGLYPGPVCLGANNPASDSCP